MDPLVLGLLIATAAISLVGLALVIGLFRRGRGGSRDQLERAIREELRATGGGLRDELAAQRKELADHLGRERDERLTAQSTQRADLEKALEAATTRLQMQLTTSLEANAKQIEGLSRSNAEKHDELQKRLREELDALRKGNEEKLEQMRATVDEKLQGTLEKRLGESFALVSKRLEEVQRGLGEMQTLASDVGGLKRVLTNVKNRGGWGEVMLEAQLEDILSPDQYDSNVRIRPDSREQVEFAVKLPGRDDSGAVVYLPIDSKYPQEDYERLLDAQERGEKDEIDAAGKALERAVLEQAKTISTKYIDPPHSTDFAIMYFPTEGLFAEVLRRPELASRMQRDHRVLITGPTTLMSLLNSLQMGFRTLAIEKRSSEVWKILSAAKTEFRNYGQVMDTLAKQLGTAQNTVSKVGTRTRAIERTLKSVETLEGVAEPAALAGDAVEEIESAIPDADRTEED